MSGLEMVTSVRKGESGTSRVLHVLPALCAHAHHKRQHIAIHGRVGFLAKAAHHSCWPGILLCTRLVREWGRSAEAVGAHMICQHTAGSKEESDAQQLLARQPQGTTGVMYSTYWSQLY